MGGDIEVHDAPPVVHDEKERVQGMEGKRLDGEEV
jgi:hypothetical protein